MAFYIVKSKAGHDVQTEYNSRKLALKQFEILIKKDIADYICVVHQTKQIDEVIAYWENPR